MPDEVFIRGRSKNGTRNKAVRLELIGDGVSREPWSTEEKAELKGCLQAGWRPIDFERAKELGLAILRKRNRNAIAKQIQRMELGNKRRSRAAKKAHRFTEAEQQQFRDFLRLYASYKTPEQIMKLWNKSHSLKVKVGRVRTYLVAMKIKPPWAVIVKMPYSKSKQKRGRKSKKTREAVEKRWQEYWKAKREKLYALLLELEDEAVLGKTKLVKKRCKMIVDGVNFGCGVRWPDRPPFFRQRAKRTKSKGVQVYTAHLCVICQNKRRRG